MDHHLLKQFKSAFGGGQQASGRKRVWNEMDARDEPGGNDATEDPDEDGPDFAEADLSLRKTLQRYDALIVTLQKAGVDKAVVLEAQRRTQDARAFLEKARDRPADPARAARQLQELEAALDDQIWEARDLALKRPMKVASGDGSVDVFWSDIDGFEVYEERTREQLLQTVGGKTARGNGALERLASGEEGGEPTASDATDLLWALQGKARAGNSEHGDELTLPDSPALRRYLEKCQGALFPKAFTGPSGGGSLDLWGFDTHDGHERMLPAGLGRLEWKTEKGPDGTPKLVISLVRDASALSGHFYPTTAASQAVDVLRRAAESCAKYLDGRVLPEAAEERLSAECLGLVGAAPQAARAALKLSLSGDKRLAGFLFTLGTLAGSEQGKALAADKGFLRRAMGCLGDMRRTLFTEAEVPS